LKPRLNTEHWLALGILATAGPGVSYVNVLLNSFTRWALLLALILSIGLRRLFLGLTGWSAFFGYMFLMYCVLSSVWSDLPVLSSTKSVVYLLVGLCYTAGGAKWARAARRDDVLKVFWPIAFLALFAGIGGGAAVDASLQVNEALTIYRGLSDNSNYLGMLSLCALPVVLWSAGRSATTKRKRHLYLLLSFVIIGLLLKTFSRASLLSASVLLSATLIGLGARKNTIYIAALAGAFISAAVFFPQELEGLIRLYVYKGGSHEDSLFLSRQDTWSASLDAAAAGGLFGRGYGVSYSFSDFQLGWSSLGYGREKGNVTLAMVEEVGWLGLTLFLGMLLAFFTKMISTARRARRSDDRLLVSILIGAILALLVNAQFEAWLLSPGGAATPVFWTLIGIATAIVPAILKDARRIE